MAARAGESCIVLEVYTYITRRRSVSKLRSSASIATHSSRRCANLRRTRAEVDGDEPALGELRDRRPGLLRLDLEAAELDQAGEQRLLERDAAGGRVRRDLELAGASDQLAQPRLRLVAAASRRVAVVDRRDGLGGDHVRGDPALEPRHREHLAEDEAARVDVERLQPHEAGKPLDGEPDRVHARPRPRGVGALAVEAEQRVQVAEAARVELVVGRLEDDDEVGVVDEPGLEQRRQGGEGDVDLLQREEAEVDVDRERGPLGGDPARELDHDGDAALHVGGAEAVHGAAADPAGDVALRGNRVEVPGEEQHRLAVRPVV